MRKQFRTYQLALEFYRLISALRIHGHLRDQLQRAASSIALNLSEGTGRRTKPDQIRFFHIAFGSLRECQAILDLTEPQNPIAVVYADKLAAHIYRLIHSAG